MAFEVSGPTSTLTNSLLGNATNIVAYAQGRVATVDSYITNMQNAVLSLVAPVINPEFPTGGEMPSISIPDAPTFETPVWTAPGLPAAFTGELDLSDLTIEPFDEDPPTIQYGTAPTPFSGTMPDAPGVNLTFEDPTLTVNMPAPPALIGLNIVPFGGMTLPTFTESDPVLTAVTPTIREYTPGAQYTSALLTALKASLEDRITNGGTGLNQDVENAIWDRGREREARSASDAILDLERMEALGYSSVPGIYLAARTKIMTETDFANRGHSREVMIESARLELDNVKHALTTATQLEGQLIDYTNATEQRIFESTRYATEAGISIYNAQVQAFGAMVDVYRAKVGAYEARIRAEVAKVDAYRATIAAEEAKASINRSLVDQYRTMVDAALANVEVYKARIAGIQAKAEIEKAKVQVYGEQVRGYVAQINAYTAGVEGFRASLEAEKTKQQVYQSQVEAFSARVNATARISESRIEAFKGQISAYTAELEGYRATISGESARVDGVAKIAGVVSDTYKSTVAGASAYNELLTKRWQAVLDQNQRTAEIGIQAAKANAEMYVTTRSLALDAAKTGAQVAAQIGAAALNAVNYSGSVSSSESFGQSISASSSVSTSSSTSSSQNYNYNYSV